MDNIIRFPSQAERSAAQLERWFTEVMRRAGHPPELASALFPAVRPLIEILVHQGRLGFHYSGDCPDALRVALEGLDARLQELGDALLRERIEREARDWLDSH